MTLAANRSTRGGTAATRSDVGRGTAAISAQTTSTAITTSAAASSAVAGSRAATAAAAIATASTTPMMPVMAGTGHVAIPQTTAATWWRSVFALVDRTGIRVGIHHRFGRGIAAQAVRGAGRRGQHVLQCGEASRRGLSLPKSKAWAAAAKPMTSINANSIFRTTFSLLCVKAKAGSNRWDSLTRPARRKSTDRKASRQSGKLGL